MKFGALERTPIVGTSVTSPRDLGVSRPARHQDLLNPVPEGEEEEAVEEFDIPEDAYGAATLAIVRDFQEAALGSGVCLNVVTGISSLLLNVVNLALQFMITIFLHLYVVSPKVHKVQTLYRDYHAEVFDEDGQFQLVKWEHFDRQLEICQIAVTNEGFYITSLFLWWTSMMKELRTTWRLFINISSVPSCARGPDMLKVSHSDGDTFGEAHEVKAAHVHIVALTASVRSCLYLFVCLPKLIICLALLWLGSQWLSATNQFEDLIMNAVAMTFVTHIDEMLYDVLLPGKYREEVAAINFVIPAAKGTPREVRNREIARGFMRSGVYLGIIIVGIVLYSQLLQDVLPHDVHDLRANCAKFMQDAKPICSETLLHRVQSILQTGAYSQKCYPYGPGPGG